MNLRIFNSLSLALIGGRQMKTELESRMEKVYAGVTLSREGRVVPSMYLPFLC